MLTLDAPAKVNLFLNVLGPRPDGYHDIVSLMHTLELRDSLQLTVREPDGEAPDVAFTCSEPSLKGRDNLVVKAYEAFWPAVGLSPVPLNAHLEKRIPWQAGLGGGSSDAAAMLLGLAWLAEEFHGQAIPLDTLLTIATGLGSDVPFLVRHRGLGMIRGRGELLSDVDIQLPALPVLIVKPRAFGIPTADAYQALREQNAYQERPVAPILSALSSVQSPGDLESLLWNDFEAALLPKYPPLEAMARMLETLGAARPILCGSGAAMMALLTPTDALREQVTATFPETLFEHWWTSLRA
jgi:4-diphosphocytidyl-2-C-methyl-D-erythritol kinase